MCLTIKTLFLSKKHICAPLLLILILSLFAPIASAEEPVLQTSPLNPEYIDYLNNPENYTSGYIPPPMRIVQSDDAQLPTRRSTLPAKYDTRYDAGVNTSLFPAVRNQGADGLCWAFAAYGSLEFNLAKAGKSFGALSAPFDFSENNMNFSTSMYAYAHDATPPNPVGFNRIIGDGSNAHVATAYLTRWNGWGGPVLERDDPYNLAAASTPRPKDSSLNNKAPVLHVQNVMFIPDVKTKAYTSTEKTTRDTQIKQAIMDYGAVNSSFCVDWDCFNYSNPITETGQTSYYCPYAAPTNHAITIVGWDNNYPASNFATNPSGNGAWIVRNSWGSYWGDGGYFHISYYDPNIGEESVAFYNAEPISNYDKLYMHDPFGVTGSVGYSRTTPAYMRNDFTVSVNPEYLSAVSFYTTDQNAAYSVYVDTDTSNGISNFSSATPIVSGTVGYGYHTIKLPNKLKIEATKTFAVVVKIQNTTATSTSDSYPIPMESTVAGHSSQAAPSGKSYLSSNGSTWSPLTSYDVCLRACTTTETPYDFEIDSASTTGNIIINKLKSTASGTLVLNYKSASGNGIVRYPFDFGINSSIPPISSSIPAGAALNSMFIWDGINGMNPLSKKFTVIK